MENSQSGRTFKPYITIALIAVNTAVLFIMEAMGGSEDSRILIRMGAMYPPLVYAGQYWRVFTAMFLHIGFAHLLSNMVSLFIFGNFMEERIGRFRYLILYLGSGVLGNLFSLWISHQAGDESLTAGASGAIFGLMGGLIVLALFRRNLVQGMTPLRVVIVIILMILPGFTTPNVSVTGHIGGVIGGFLIMLMLLPTMRRSW